MQLSDDIYLGPAVCGGSFVSDGSSPMTVGVGPMGRVYVYDIVPATLAANNIATSQNPGSGASFTLTAGAGVTQITLANGSLGYQLDVPRAIRVVAAGANTATYTISGYDVYGQAMTQTIAAPSTSTVTTTKAFKVITSITNANATAGTNGLTVGTTDVFGLPVAVTNVAYILSVKWNSTLASDAGTFVAAVATSPATATTGDVRGTYTPSANASDGSRRLVMAIAVPAIGSGPNATRLGAYGVTQF
jgi:hypothetical protein